MLREIVLDTETTGLDAANGDRLIELGCVEILNRFPSGKEFHVYINPERDVPAEAERIHGLSTDFLKDKPLFTTSCDSFLDFIGDAPLVIHNASFDIGFINMELQRLGKTGIRMDRVIDTLQLARRKHPGAPNTLDALCKRYGIDNSKRVKHGAIIDVAAGRGLHRGLLGARQAALGLERQASGQSNRPGEGPARLARPRPLSSRLSKEEEERHAAFVAELGDGAVWNKFTHL